jgi:hypothetical protein
MVTVIVVKAISTMKNQQEQRGLKVKRMSFKESRYQMMMGWMMQLSPKSPIES